VRRRSRSKKLLLLVPLVAAGLELGPVGLTGKVSVTSENIMTSDAQADTLGQPHSRLACKFSPTVSFWGFPVSFDLRFETMKSLLGKPFELLGLSIDPSRLGVRLPSLGWLAGSLRDFEVGTCSPRWTPLTLSGASIRGGAIELNPGPMYVAAAVGQARQAVEGSDSIGLLDSQLSRPDSLAPSYRRMLYAGRLGYGSKQGSHIYLTGMYVSDDPKSIQHTWYNKTTDGYQGSNPASAIARVEARPAENVVGGAELNLSLFRGRAGLESELAGTVFTPDNRLPAVRSDSVSDVYERVFQPNASTIAPDYSFRVRPWVRLSGTSVYTEVERVGARHLSLGATGLRTGFFSYGTGFETRLSKDRVSVSAAYEHEDDSPSGLAEQRTTIHSGSAGLGLSFPGLPTFRLGYSPRFVRSANEKEDCHKAVLGAGYRFKTGSVSHSPGLSMVWQRSSSASSGSTKVDVTVSHGLGFSRPFSLAVSTGYGWQESDGDVRPFVKAGVSPSFTALRVWKNTVSYGLSTETGESVHTVGIKTAFPLWKLANANLSVKQKFSSGENASLHELQLGGGLSTSW
jgi:hypothetical protein